MPVRNAKHNLTINSIGIKCVNLACNRYVCARVKSLLSRSFSHTVSATRFFRQNSLNLVSFSFLLGVRVCLANVSVHDVRDVINVNSAEISDSRTAKMAKLVEVTLELETDKEISQIFATVG